MQLSNSQREEGMIRQGETSSSNREIASPGIPNSDHFSGDSYPPLLTEFEGNLLLGSEGRVCGFHTPVEYTRRRNSGDRRGGSNSLLPCINSLVLFAKNTRNVDAMGTFH